jgi:predicted TIM-barrel fold metal-dependent hydrolase
MKIDIYSHILPKRYKEALFKTAKDGFYIQETVESTPPLFDLEERFRLMDKYEGLVQILTLGAPPVEAVVDEKETVDLSRLANDEMAEIVMKYPDRFPAAIACLPMNNMDAAIEECERAIEDLRFRGVQIATPINDKPLDSPEFIPLFEKMCEYDLPIWIHPMRPASHSDYKTENSSKYRINVEWGWVYETSVAMARLVFSGILERFPELKIITHHAGGMTSFMEHKIKSSYDRAEMREGDKTKQGLRKDLIDYFKMFYCDTALNGNTAGLNCACSFFGADHMLFATDAPFDSQLGHRTIRDTIKSVEEMDIDDSDRHKIFEKNARNLLRLPI